MHVCLQILTQSQRYIPLVIFFYADPPLSLAISVHLHQMKTTEELINRDFDIFSRALELTDEGEILRKKRSCQL